MDRGGTGHGELRRSRYRAPLPLPCLGAGMEVVLNQDNRACRATKFVILNNLAVKFVIPEELRAGKSGEPAASHNLSANNKATAWDGFGFRMPLYPV